MNKNPKRKELIDLISEMAVCLILIRSMKLIPVDKFDDDHFNSLLRRIDKLLLSKIIPRKLI